jgi:hypothetical protein
MGHLHLRARVPYKRSNLLFCLYLGLFIRGSQAVD